MKKYKDLIPSFKICARCPNFRSDLIEALDVDGAHLVDSEHYWECEMFDGSLIYVPVKAIKGGTVIQLETNLPQKCPFILEQVLTQEDAGQERWADLQPLLKLRSQQAVAAPKTPTV